MSPPLKNDVRPARHSSDSRRTSGPALRRSIAWGVAIGFLCAALPLRLWWLPAVTVYAVAIAAIAAIYIGFAVSDGRPVLVVEIAVAAGFVLLAVVSLGAPRGALWLDVTGLSGHGLKDLWQHRTQFARNNRWWPPFCATTDFVAALVITTAALS